MSGATEGDDDPEKVRKALLDRARQSLKWAGEAHRSGDPSAILDVCNALGDILHVLENDARRTATPTPEK